MIAKKENGLSDEETVKIELVCTADRKSGTNPKLEEFENICVTGMALLNSRESRFWSANCCRPFQVLNERIIPIQHKIKDIQALILLVFRGMSLHYISR